MVKSCPCLEWYVDRSRIFGHVPQLGRLHFFTPALLGVGCNLAFVKIFFNDLGSDYFLMIWLLTILTLCRILFSLGSLCRIGRFCLIVLNASMFLGL